jgi:hypothetical protein
LKASVSRWNPDQYGRLFGVRNPAAHFLHFRVGGRLRRLNLGFKRIPNFIEAKREAKKTILSSNPKTT